MNRFFNMDNKFFVFMGRVADLLLLNFLCILTVLFNRLEKKLNYYKG